MKCLLINFTLVISTKDYTESTYIFIGLFLTEQMTVVMIPCESKKPGELFSWETDKKC